MEEENIFPARTHFSCSLVNHSHKERKPLFRSEWHEPSRSRLGSVKTDFRNKLRRSLLPVCPSCSNQAQVTVRTASLTAPKPTSGHLKQLRAGPILLTGTRSRIRRSEFTKETTGQIVNGSCQSKVLFPSRVVHVVPKTRKSHRQSRNHIDRNPGAMPNAQVDHLGLRKWPIGQRPLVLAAR
jgi:hypothetical protein